MHCNRKIKEDLIYIGGSDRRLARFENLFPIPRGVSYNSYVLLDEKTVLFDTVDASIGRQFFDNLTHSLSGRVLDYIIIHHMEPDHGVLLGEMFERYPAAKLVCSARALDMIGQFFPVDVSGRTLVVGEGDKLCTGKHTLHFLMAPMVHWPEVMVTYDEPDKTLFSADAFGMFGALSGNIFDDELEFDSAWMQDARRYYGNIVGKFGAQVQALLKKAAAFDIECVCPLHGPIWRSNPALIIDKYQKWSSYEPEEQAVVIFYASMYGNTENAVSLLANELAEAGVRNIAMHDVSGTDISYLIAECFRCSHLVFAAPTYNGGIHPKIENLLTDMKALFVQNRTVALMDNGTWAPSAARQMAARLEEMKNMTLLEGPISIKSSLSAGQEQALTAMAGVIAEQIK